MYLLNGSERTLIYSYHYLPGSGCKLLVRSSYFPDATPIWGIFCSAPFLSYLSPANINWASAIGRIGTWS